MTMIPNRFSLSRSKWGLGASALAIALAAPALAEDPRDPSAAAKGPPAAPATPAATSKEKAAPEKAAAGKPDDRGAGLGKPGAKLKERQGLGPDAGENAEGGPKKLGPPGLGQRGAPGNKRKVDREAALQAYKEALQAMKETENVSGAEDEKSVQARKDAMRAMSKARRDLRATHRHVAREFLEERGDSIQKLRSKLRARAAQMRASRKERAEKHVDEIKKEWGEKTGWSPVREELATHAWRVARLERLVAIAETTESEEALKRAKELLEKEREAHPARLKAAVALGPQAPKASKDAGKKPQEAPKAAAAAKTSAPTPKAPVTPPPAPAGGEK